MKKTSALAFWVLLLAFSAKAEGSFATQAYIEQYADLAMDHMNQHGIPASIKLAQGLLESDKGRSSAARIYHAHFGIKATKAWSGKLFYKEDDDFDVHGRRVKSKFRAYESDAASYEDHSIFLQQPRYVGMFKLSSTDYFSWAVQLQALGYATSQTYAQSLIRLIEQNDLDRYDIAVRQLKHILANNIAVSEQLSPRGMAPRPKPRILLPEPPQRPKPDPTPQRAPSLFKAQRPKEWLHNGGQ
jgi:flagellum-specific peptidoglycan hydrolase FlgJ